MTASISDLPDAPLLSDRVPNLIHIIYHLLGPWCPCHLQIYPGLSLSVSVNEVTPCTNVYAKVLSSNMSTFGSRDFVVSPGVHTCCQFKAAARVVTTGNLNSDVRIQVARCRAYCVERVQRNSESRKFGVCIIIHVCTSLVFIPALSEVTYLSIMMDSNFPKKHFKK